MTNAQSIEQPLLEPYENDFSQQYDDIIIGLNIVKLHISKVQQKLKLLEKGIKKQMNTLKKEANKNKNKKNRKPSGFAKPCKVTKELCKFMNKEEGTEIARTDVTKALVSYIKENKLENMSNGKIITPDEALKRLLGLEDGEELTYFTNNTPCTAYHITL